MITLYGVTEDGTTVPVQVTEDGKLVVHKEGGYTPGMDLEAGTITANHIETTTAYMSGNLDMGVDVDQQGFGVRIDSGGTAICRRGETSATFKSINNKNGEETFRVEGSGNIISKGEITSALALRVGSADYTSDNARGVGITEPGSVYIQKSKDYSGGADMIRAYKGKTIAFKVTRDGSVHVGDALGGITKFGELYFTSRGDRYKIVVQNGMCMADTYTREQQIRDGLSPDVDTTDIVRPD